MKHRKSPFLLLSLLLLSAAPLSGLRYRFDYDLMSDVRKTVALVYKIRLYYHANASAIFNSYRLPGGGQAFRFAGIPATGSRIRTHRNGSSLSVVTADYTFARARAAFEPRIRVFRRLAPYYAPMVERISRRPFRILPTTGNSIRFDRKADGSGHNYGFALKMIKPHNFPKYGNSFNIYKLLLEMVKLMHHRALPGNTLAGLPADGRSWNSPWLNFGKDFSRISYLADYQTKKHAKYYQKHSFRITYRVSSRANGRITITGRGAPNISMGMDMKVKRYDRTLVYRAATGTLLKDTLHMNVTTDEGYGWKIRANLRLF